MAGEKPVKTHQPCPCGQSSDAYAIWADGHGYCYGQCNGTYFPAPGEKEWSFPMSDNVGGSFSYEYIARRGISKETHEFFGVKAKIDEEGKPISVAYPYPTGWQQLKRLDKKEFWSSGDVKPGGFGKDRFPAGSARSVTITEGADDAMSVFEIMGKYPVYSVRSATIPQALADIRADFDWLNSFEKIYLCLDSDKPGQDCAAAIAAVFGYKKVYHVKLAPRKDATEYLEHGEKQVFKTTWYNADRYLPDGIVNTFASIKKLFDSRKRHSRWETPFPELNEKLGGGLEIHRSYLVSGLTGIGKTELLRACENKFFQDRPDENIAILHFEEPITETVERAVGYKLKTPLHIQAGAIPEDQVLKEFEALAGRDERVHFMNHYGSEDLDVILEKIRFYVTACGCTQVYLDNITVLCTGAVQDDERKALDYFSTRLEMLVKELPFTLVAISHENENEGTRGSQNINKVFDVWINLKRDVENENDVIQRTLWIKLKKNRQASKTGPAGKAIYSYETSMLTPVTEELPT